MVISSYFVLFTVLTLFVVLYHLFFLGFGTHSPENVLIKKRLSLFKFLLLLSFCAELPVKLDAMCGFYCQGLLCHHVLVGDFWDWIPVAPNYIFQLFGVLFMLVGGFSSVYSSSTNTNSVNIIIFGNSW